MVRKRIIRFIAALLGVSVWDENGVLCGARETRPADPD